MLLPQGPNNLVGRVWLAWGPPMFFAFLLSHAKFSLPYYIPSKATTFQKD